MIRLRIERTEYDVACLERTREMNGLVWFENGQEVGRVIIEQEVTTAIVSPEGYHATCAKWIPVEVIDD